MRPIEAEEPPENTESKIVAEIAERLIEWSEGKSRVRVSRWLSTLSALHRSDPAAMWLYIAWQTGDTARIASSFEERGVEGALPRQAVQQATARAFDAIRHIMPELAVAMRETFEAHSPEAEKTLGGESAAA